MTDYNFFTCVVAGNDPHKLMEKYDKKIEVDRHLRYKFSDREKIKTIAIADLSANIQNGEIPKNERSIYKSMRNDIMKMSSEEYFFKLAEDNMFDVDPKTNDLYSVENDDGFWTYYHEGKFVNPFKLKDGTESYQALKGDIDWDATNSVKKYEYETAWDTVMGGKVPLDEKERKIYENMKNRTAYFEKFGSRENYVLTCTAFWGYAFVSENGHKILDEMTNQFIWVKNFYKRFIEPLDDSTMLTIFECRK